MKFTAATIEAPAAREVVVGEGVHDVNPLPEHVTLKVIGAGDHPVLATVNVADPVCPAVPVTVPPVGLTATCGGGGVTSTSQLRLAS
jgi:hypothetical protein